MPLRRMAARPLPRIGAGVGQMKVVRRMQAARGSDHFVHDLLTLACVFNGKSDISIQLQEVNQSKVCQLHMCTVSCRSTWET